MPFTPTGYDPYDFANRRHIGPSPEEMAEMLAAVGAESLDALIDETVPAGLRQGADLDWAPMTEEEYEELTEDDGKILIHRDELGDVVAGTVAGYLHWSGLIVEQPRVVTAVERLLHRQLGPEGRELVSIAGELADER